MPSGPPSSATHFTRSRSDSENSMPIENIRSTTPISATSSKVWTSETDGPGVNGPMRMPPSDVAEDQRLAREPGQRAAQHGGDEHVGEIAKDDRVGLHG